MVASRISRTREFGRRQRDGCAPAERTDESTGRNRAELADADFVPVSMRNATAFGFSPRLRADIVLNNLVGHALLSNTIRVLSDGTPWRPLTHAEDIAQAIDSIGGQLDAFTAKEYASYYIKVLDEHLPMAVDLLSDIVMNPNFAADDAALDLLAAVGGSEERAAHTWARAGVFGAALFFGDSLFAGTGGDGSDRKARDGRSDAAGGRGHHQREAEPLVRGAPGGSEDYRRQGGRSRRRPRGGLGGSGRGLHRCHRRAKRDRSGRCPELEGETDAVHAA